MLAMKKQLTYLFVFLTSAFMYSQTFFVKVLDIDTKQPIEKVHLKLGSKVYLTNKEGLAIITPINTTNLEITHIKYLTKVIKLKGKRRKEVFLSEKQSTLKEVVISSKRTLKKYVNYTELEELPKPIHSFGSLLIKDKLYTFGGDGSVIEYSNKRGLSELLDSNENNILKFLTKAKIGNFYRYRGQSYVYDFTQKKWELYSKELIKRAYHKAVVHNDSIYIIGGKRLTLTKKKEMLVNQIEIVSNKDKSISIDKMNPHQAVNFESVVFKNKLLLIGGSIKLKANGLKEYTDKIHMYNIKTGYWYELTSMSKGKETRGVIVNNKLYLFGGFKDKNLKEIESFDLVSGKWNLEGLLFSSMRNPAIAKNKNMIYLFENNNIISYNTVTKSLKSYQIKLPLFSSEMHYKDNKLFILGGSEKGDFTSTPQKHFIEISIDEFDNTKIQKQKILKPTNAVKS